MDVLTYKNFKNMIDPTILKRGLDYFKSGSVIDIEEDDGMWIAQVEGSELYDVTISEHPEEGLIHACDCPYDWGPVCKHIAAVLYAIEEKHNTTILLPKNFKKKKKSKTQQIRDALDTLSKDELIDFIVGVTKSDRKLGHKIIAQYGQYGVDKQSYVNLIENIIKGETDRGYLDYRGSQNAAHQIYHIMQQGKSAIDNGKYENALIIYMAVMECSADAMPNADDSSGELGGCVSDSLMELEESIEKFPQNIKDELFEYCTMEALSERYSYAWTWEMLSLAAELVSNETQRYRLFDVLDTYATPQNARYYGLRDYKREQAQRIKLRLIERLDDEEALFQFLNENDDIDIFREQLIRTHIDNGKLKEARRLCENWLEDPDKKHIHGYKQIFTQFLFDIAKRENNRLEVLRLTEELFLETADFQYFDALKASTPEAKWKSLRGKLIKLIQDGRYRSDLIPSIYVCEEMWDDLLKYIRIDNNRHILERYRKELETHFPDEVVDMYEKIARKILQQNTNRSAYQEACIYLKRIQQLVEEEYFILLTDELRQQYKTRRAFLDELSKI